MNEQKKSLKRFLIKLIVILMIISVGSPFFVFFMVKNNQSVFTQKTYKYKDFTVQIFKQVEPTKEFVRLILFLDNPKFFTQTTLHINPIIQKGICSLPRALFIDSVDHTQRLRKIYKDKNLKVFIVKNNKAYALRNIDSYYIKDLNIKNIPTSLLWEKHLLPTIKKINNHAKI